MLLTAAPVAHAAYELLWYSVDAGGNVATVSGGGYTLQTTIAQPDAANAAGSPPYTLEGGFWSIVPNPCAGGPIRGDANCDGRVNNFDIDGFLAAVLSPLSPTAPAAYLPGDPDRALCWAARLCWGDLEGAVSPGAITNFDVDPFVSCVLVLPPQGQPCP